MKKMIFNGVCTALITPFKDGYIDFTALDGIIDMQIESGIDALVIAGTTGEAATLSEKERISLFEFCAAKVNGRLPLIFGVGTNDTRQTARLAKDAEKLSADGILVVTPYYNKGTEDGLIKHYLTVAEATRLPIVLYNVPKRTGVDLKISSIKRLAECERIVAIKEAGDSIDKLTQLAAMGDELTLYSGNDSQIYACLAVGGAGVISVASNVIPREIKNVCEAYRTSPKEALRIQNSLMGFIDSLFLETNPSPIKYAMHSKGYCEEELRLPLAPPCDKTKRIIEEEIKKISYNK